ncbi:MAG: NIPSNAP family protein [bacterium]
MHRRDLIKAGLITGASVTTGFRAPTAAADSRHHYELRTYELRSDISSTALRNFYKDALVPAYARAGAGAVGLFSPETGFPSQSLLVLIEYPSIDAVRTVAEKLDADAAFMAAQRTFETGADLPYLRYDSRLMRAFTGHSSVEVPPGPASRPARVFELRTYEARSATALERKIAMFNEAEIGLFRSIGMTPVFFGENLFGTRLPSLTYMLTFEDMTARYKAWGVFGSHPDWQRINKDEKYAVNGSVTVTNVAYLRPLAFSPIR